MATASSTDTYGSKPDSRGAGVGTDPYKSDSSTPSRSTSDSAYSGGMETKPGYEHGADSAKDKIAGIKDKAKEKLDGAADAATDAAGSISDLVSKNPMTALGIAAALGMLVGLAFIRPRS